MNQESLDKLIHFDRHVKGSPFRLKNSKITISDLKNFQNINKIQSYIKLYHQAERLSTPHWGRYAYLDCDWRSEYKHDGDDFNIQKNKVNKDGDIIFNESERLFLSRLKRNLGIFNNECIYQKEGFRTYEFDGIYHAFINLKNNTRVILQGSAGDESVLPKTIDSLDISNIESFEMPSYINAVDPENAEWGFYACYQGLSWLSRIHRMHPWDHEFSRYKSKDKFLNDLITTLSKCFDGKEVNFLVTHHCHSLAMLLAAIGDMWEIWQYIHIIAYTDEESISVGLELFD